MGPKGYSMEVVDIDSLVSIPIDTLVIFRCCCVQYGLAPIIQVEM